ncbi:fasciclin domain-containing protein [Schlegelella sp. S2-27]|uniref:Fasciclin domain-containing protein n=1 Tax=Caldimonas mangrovi TaxID=2944811 RepID=A0ABT0YQD4_9BURK|nr:fasciclin domain-containing protein [Caldimonas mangrovi]MCM5680946.1 fasciclin domain-containing protein [Caldimonas mangrovi]
MNKRTWLLASGAALLTAFAGCASTSGTRTVADTAAADPQLSTLNRLIREAGLDETLRTAGPYTVFAPSDDAFKAVPPATLAALAKDKQQLRAVLSYHVVPGKMAAADVKNGSVKTVLGENIALAKAGSFVTVEDAMVTRGDAVATNGVVHVIDRVLMPPKKK